VATTLGQLDDVSSIWVNYQVVIMRLYEHEGMELFKKEGIPVPKYYLASNSREARDKAEKLGLPVVIKAQILAGGRWLAGGVHTAHTLEQVEEHARNTLHSRVRGLPVRKVVVAPKVQTYHEFYLGVTVDEYYGIPVAILSTVGGISVEEAAKIHPELVTSRYIRIGEGLSLAEAQQMAREVGLLGDDLTKVADILFKLYNLLRKYDAMVAEINPLAQLPSGECMALDAKIEVDDSSLYRHQDLKEKRDERIVNKLERRGRDIGVSYVELDGDIAIIASGAGLGMATMDIIGSRLRPANFLETGGAISEELLYNVMDLVLQKEGIKAVFINVYGGINPIHEGAKGVGRYIKDHNITIPIVAKALGNRQEETWEIFKEHGVVVVEDVSTEKGVELLARILEEKK
jgi:succinyl-CoA synthetase beta subunit